VLVDAVDTVAQVCGRRVVTEPISMMPAQTDPFSCSCTYVNLDWHQLDCHPGINAVVFMQEADSSVVVWIV
jgi:hypothetical protein